MFARRIDRLLTILAFFISLWVVVGLAGLVFEPFGPLELLIALALSIPLTLVLSRGLRVVLTKR